MVKTVPDLPDSQVVLSALRILTPYSCWETKARTSSIADHEVMAGVRCSEGVALMAGFSQIYRPQSSFGKLLCISSSNLQGSGFSLCFVNGGQGKRLEDMKKTG